MRRAFIGTLVLVAGCGAGGGGPVADQGRGTVRGTVEVVAAASLTAAFDDVGRAFAAAYPGVEARFSFAGSSTLAAQLLQGAPADVFASADEASMQRVAAAGLVDGAPVTFATNRLEIVVPKGNPRGIHELADLARPGLVVALCAAPVPCGRYAAEALAASRVALTPRSLEQDVKGVVTKVALGEADAGIVYATDVLDAGPAVEGVRLPEVAGIVPTYPVAALKPAPNLAAARAFVAFLRSPAGLAILRRHGFGGP